MCGNSNDLSRTKQRPHAGKWMLLQIFLPEMNSVGIHIFRDVGEIVDDQWNADRTRNGQNRRCHRYDLFARFLLRAKLDDVSAALNQHACNVFDSPTCEIRSINKAIE